MSIFSDNDLDIATKTLTSCIPSNTSVDHLIAQLTDSTSLWHDLKLAEMSGYDYVFAPDAACRQLRNLPVLADFLASVQTILGTNGPRTILISYWHDRERQLHFEKYHVEWAEGTATDWHIELLDDSPQHDFIEMLFEHSEKLIIEA